MEASHLQQQKQELFEQLQSIDTQLAAFNYNTQHSNGNHIEQNNDDEGNAPFEGPEKLLELWWEDSATSVPHPKGLRAVKRNDWESMLDLVHCKVLSVIQGNGVDAYMLSESSMFVWPHKLILKTCGTTTLLLGLEAILRLAHSVGFTKGVWRAFYSRKSFMFPEAQKGPHRDWKEEMSVLDKHFVGSGYTVGPMNGDHWLLYISEPRDEVLGHIAVVDDRANLANASPTSSRRSPPDQSVEILMSDLHPDACASFYFPESGAASRMDGYNAGKMLSDKLGISKLFTKAATSKPSLDSYLFQPCGYSANLVIQEDRYATIHVTPEVECSYASFETNVAFGLDADDRLGLRELVENVLAIFKPGRWCLTLFVSREDEDEAESAGEQSMNRMLKGNLFKEFRRTDKICYEFEDYDLLFSCFKRDSVR